MVRRPIVVAVLLLACAAAAWWWPRGRGDGDGALRSYTTRADRGEEGPSTYPSDWAWIRRTAPWWRADAAAFRQATEQARAMRAAAGAGFS